MQFRSLLIPIPLAILALVHCDGPSGDEAKTAAPLDGGGDSPVVSPADAGRDANAQPNPLASMAKARSLFAAVNGHAGDVRTFAGLTGAGLDDTTESYDPIANTWSRAPAAASARRYGHAATQDAAGRIFVLGGTTDGQTPIALAEIFSPEDGAWQTIADLPTARLGIAAATGKDGRVYAIGGRDASGAASDVVEVYSEGTHAWSPATSLPTKRLALVAVTGTDGKIYAIGGRDSDDTPLAVVEAFDTDKGTWAKVQSLGTARYWFGATLGADGRIYALGGLGDRGFLDDVEVYAPAAGWKPLTAMPEARGWLTAGASPDGRVFAIGGSTPIEEITTTQPPPVRTMLAFDTRTGLWTK